MRFNLTDWQNGVLAGQRTVRIAYVAGYDCWDVLVDGDAMKRIFKRRNDDPRVAQNEAIVRAHHAYELFVDQSSHDAVCPECARPLGVVKGRLPRHNTQESAPGRVGVRCLGSEKEIE